LKNHAQKCMFYVAK